MDYIERMAYSTEGILYLVMMAFSVIPLIIGIYRFFKGITFWSSFFLWVGLFHIIWFCGVLLLIYDGTPPGIPSILYPLLAIAWIVFLSWLMCLGFKKKSVNVEWYKRLRTFLFGTVASFLTFFVIILMTFSVFVFGESYHAKTGEKAWLSEQEIRTVIGIASMPKSVYNKELSRTGYNMDWTEQNHWAKFTRKPSSAFYKCIERKSKEPNSGWEEKTYENGPKEYRFHGAVKRGSEKYKVFVCFPKDNDSLWISIVF